MKNNSVKEKVWDILNKKPSRVVLILWLMTMEFFGFKMLRDEEFSLHFWLWLLIAFVAWLVAFGIGYSRKDSEAPFGLNKVTIQKLFVGSITKSNPYSIFVLFVFLGQITWCFDLGGKLFVEWDFDWKWLVAFAVSTAVLFAIGMMFSIPKTKDITPDKCKLLLSGFSGSGTIKEFNIEGAIRPIIQAPHDNSGNENDAFAIEEWMIVPSHELRKMKIDDDVSQKHQIPELVGLINDYNNLIDSGQWQKEKFTEIISEYIRSIYGKEIKVQLLQEVDYNSFEECYKVVTEELRKNEKEKGQDCYTVVHTSPGTAAVSAVMSTIAIKLDRQLVYTEQVPRGQDPRLLKVSIDVLSLKNWFEELSNDNE